MLQDDLKTARRLLQAGRFFEAHESLEPAWMAAAGDLKTALQGLIQIAAGLHKRSRGEHAGANYLIERGLAKIKAAGQTLPAAATDAFVGMARRPATPRKRAPKVVE